MFQVTDEIRQKVKVLAEKYGLVLVALFGSQVTGKTHPLSDTDIAFLPEQRMDLMDASRMEMDFAQTLKIKNLEMVDLMDATPLLMKQVSQKSVLLYEKERSVFARFKMYAFKIYVEAKKLLELREMSLNKFLQKI